MSESMKRLALLAGGLLAGGAILELVVRAIEPREVVREFFVRPDPVLHHVFVPGARGRHKTLEFDVAYAINSLGLREREIPREKPPGSRRILMLGDSFTEGNGVEAHDTFSSRLQVLLDGTARIGSWEVINAGVGSYSPVLEYLYLKDRGLELQPDLVILNFDLSDLHDDIQYTRLAAVDAAGRPVAVPGVPDRADRSWPLDLLVAAKDAVKTHTRTYNFVRRRIGYRLDDLRHPRSFSGDIQVDKYAMLRETGSAEDDRAWTISYRHLLEIRDLLQARGIDFWVTVFPYGLQVSPREWASGRIYWSFAAGRVYSARPQALVEQFCRRNGIPVVNMCDDFVRQAQTVYPLYYETDGHWRPAGHQLVASVLYRALVPYLHQREGMATTTRGLSRVLAPPAARVAQEAATSSSPGASGPRGRP